MKNSNGITLVALIITIIVMLILAGVSISMVVGENGIIKRAQNAIREHKIAEVKEIILTDLNSRYKTATGRNMEDVTVQKIAELSVDYDISLEKFTVHYKKYKDISKNYEMILYKAENLTNEEIKKLEEKGLQEFWGDYDEDGFITEKDFEVIWMLANNMDLEMWGYNKEKAIKIFDHDGDGVIILEKDYIDFITLYGLFEGNFE